MFYTCVALHVFTIEPVQEVKKAEKREFYEDLQGTGTGCLQEFTFTNMQTFYIWAEFL